MFLILALLPCRAGADLCRRPDGTYTNRCTDKDAAVQGGKVIWGDADPSLQGSSAAEPPAAPTPAVPSGNDERYWRDRLQQARRDLLEAERFLAHVREETGECMARQRAALGSSILDACDQGQIEAAERAADEARDFVENGLFDECRRSESCQPGWIR
jgi:hypothetical protein